MVKQPRAGVTAERYLEETLALVAEKGGSQGVNLREISRRIGCAHTNVYNYYAGLDDLLWAAFRRVIRDYAESMTVGLEGPLTPLEYFRRLVTNLASYPQQNPGLYRFIGSDPIDVERIPADVLELVTRVKAWMFEAFAAVSGPHLTAKEVEDFCNITYGYIDGETFNYINGRVVPGEDIPGRIVDNAVRLFLLLTRYDLDDPPQASAYPPLDLTQEN